MIKDGIIPKWLVTSSDGFQRQAFGIPVPHGARCLVAGIDLVRDVEGTYRVLEDNLRNPSGVSYVLENRAAMTRVLPRVFDHHLVRPVDHYGPSLLNALRRVSPAGADPEPTVVVLTPGVYNSAYFEHAFLARQMGVELVEGRDLVVDDHVVSMRTTHGLKRVDVIYRRIDDEFLDPVVFRPRLDPRHPGRDDGGAGRQRHDRQRGRQRRGRRQGRVRLRARAHQVLPRGRADPARTSRPTSCGSRTSAPT